MAAVAEDNRQPAISLKSLQVRLIKPQEREAWDALMAKNHYLGFNGIVGEALRYVAELDGQWVALMGWGSAAFKCRPRDRWIGWEPSLQWSRLKLIANNVRFLILPEKHFPNLASRVLSLNLKRLSGDWQQVYGHPILMAETFVDTARFSGASYKAAGWIGLGQSRGFGRSAGKYYEHGVPKAIFVRPLRRDAKKLLSDPLADPQKLCMQPVVDVAYSSPQQQRRLLDYLRKVKEPRKPKGLRHQMFSVLAISVCAVLSGARSLAAIAEWAANCPQKLLRRLRCRYDTALERHIPPSEPTIRRVLQQVDAEEVDGLVCAWLMEQAGLQEGDAVALDGKTLRGARVEGGRKPHLLAAILHQKKVVVAQRAVDEKSNEIPALRSTLEPLNIEGAVVTADALHTQRDAAKFIVEEKKADYVFTVKDNQSTLKDDIASLKMEAFPPSARNGG